MAQQWQGASIDFAVTRTIRDSCALLDVLQTVQPEAAFQTPLFPGKYRDAISQEPEGKLRIAVAANSPVGTAVSKDAKDALQKTVQWLLQEGYEVEEASNGIDGIRLMQDYYLMNSGEMALLARNLGRPLDTQLANLTGQPAMSVPVHVTDSGLPIGVQFMALKGQESWLLALAHQIEQSSLWAGQQGNPAFAYVQK